MDLGANSVALENIEEEKGSGDPKLKEQARGNIAMNQIRWEEAREALMTIKLEEAAASSDPTLIKTDPQSLRRQWDYMLALRQAEHMTKFLEEYHKYEQAGVAIPSWIRQAAGDALLYLRQPQKALGLYESLLTEVPTDFKIKMAMYYTLVELGRFNEAEKILQELDKDQPVRILERGLLRDNWRKADIALNRVWLLMYQDRLEVAQRDLVKDLELAPFNTALRSTMAHIYLWRGWPRRSLEEFKIVRNIDPAFLQAHIGYIIALNDNAQKKEAREEIKTLARQFPADRHVQRVQRMFDVQDMTALTLSGNYSKEFPGEDEFIFSTQLEQPLNFHHTFSMNLLRRETSRVGEKDDITRRIYLGDIWEINRSLDWRASLAADYENGENFGWTSQLTLTPDDYWKVNVSYDSHSLAVPLRSRAQGVDAREYTASMTYRLSETFNTSWTAAWKDFSDHNNNWSYSWDTETALVTRAYWKMRLRTEFDAAFNSRNDVPYFSPHAVYSFSLVPTIEHVWFRRYERAWVDRLFLGIGQQWQDEFAVKNIGYIRYEQDHHFSEVCQWLWGTTYALRNYDGNDVNTLNVDSTLRVKF